MTLLERERENMRSLYLTAAQLEALLIATPASKILERGFDIHRDAMRSVADVKHTLGWAIQKLESLNE